MTPFKYTYRGITKTVIDIKPFTTWQYWKTFGLMWIWVAIAAYLIILNSFCPIVFSETFTLYCPYLTTATVSPVIMYTIFAFVWGYFSRKKELRKNHVYEEK